MKRKKIAAISASSESYVPETPLPELIEYEEERKKKPEEIPACSLFGQVNKEAKTKEEEITWVPSRSPSPEL